MIFWSWNKLCAAAIERAAGHEDDGEAADECGGGRPWRRRWWRQRRGGGGRGRSSWLASSRFTPGKKTPAREMCVCVVLAAAGSLLANWPAGLHPFQLSLLYEVVLRTYQPVVADGCL